jgi:D-3-phosphoglycerate dehydrogenase
MLRVFLTHNPEDREAYYGRALSELSQLADVVPNPADRDLTTAELIEAADDCDVIVSHRSTPGTAELFAGSPRLLAFLRCAVDISDVDVDAATAAGVLVARADKSFVASTAELALALMLDVSRNVSASTHDYASGRLPPQQPGRQLRGRTAGIVGYGAVGTYLADLLLALGMTVVVHDPYVNVNTPGLEQVSLKALLESSDFVLPLAPANESTRDMIGAAQLAVMRPSAILINVSRGELVDEEAVVAALNRGELGGLGMDVGRAADQRPTPSLAGRPGVVATPHVGGLTPENADAQAASSATQVAAILAGEMPPRAVNPDAATRLRAWWDREGLVL